MIRPSRTRMMAAARKLLGPQVRDLHFILNGRNNVVARLDGTGGPWLAKWYFTHPGDGRDRLGAEFGMLSFLAGHGLDAVPRPIAADPPGGLAIYSFVPGRRLTPSTIGPRETDQWADLLVAMGRLRSAPEARQLPAAAEACFRLRDYPSHLRRRLDRALPDGRPLPGLDPAVARLWQQRLLPAVCQAEENLEREAARQGLAPGRALAGSARTLSPADHGFHNALRAPDGRLTFLDFEYAGWDDPAQLAANACLQPDLPLPAALRVRFLRRLFTGLGAPSALANRVVLVYPLQMLKWAMILLNEFMPVDAARRRFARQRLAESPRARLARVRRLIAAAELAWQQPNAAMRAVRAAAGD